MGKFSFDVDFQRKVLKLCCTNKKFFDDYGTGLEAELFDTQMLRTLYQLISKNVIAYDKEIDLSNLYIIIDEYCRTKSLNEEMASELRDEAKLVLKEYIGSEQFIIDSLVKFVRKKKMVNALYKCTEILKNENDSGYEQSLKLIEDAVSYGAGVSDDGLNFNDIYDIPEKYRLKYSPDKLIRTGIPGYDMALCGGMAPGELHIVQGIPKSGKSSFACALGSNMLLDGKVVFHVTLEIKELDVMLKYAARLSRLSYDQLTQINNEDYKRRMERFKKLQPNLFVQYWTNETANCLNIRSWISRIRSKKNISPDIIIVDYDDPVLGDTLIPLLDGTERRIDSLVGEKEFWLYACKEDGEIVPGRGHSARVARHTDELIEITLDNGKTIKSTPNHNHMLRDGSFKRADEFESGDSMMPLYKKTENLGYEMVKCNKTGDFKRTHRIVAEHSNDIPKGFEAHHKNHNKLDNRPENIEVVYDIKGNSDQITAHKKKCKQLEPAMHNHKVVSVKRVKLDNPVPVYCLSVDKYHNYALSAGIFTHNCLVPVGGASTDMYDNAGKIYSDLINLADYFNVPILSFAQPKREAWELPDRDHLVRSYHLAHSAKKAHKCFTLSSLNFRSDSDTGFLYADLFRRGKSNYKIPLVRNLEKCDFYQPDV